MKENKILVMIKEPGKPAVIEPLFDNTLKSFQETVGGYIETVTINPELVIICNEEGRLRGLPFNVEVADIGFVGTVVVAGTKGDEFSSVRGALIPFVRTMLGG